MKIICVWFLWYGARQRIFSHFGPSFALLHPSRPNDPENQNFEKMKKKKKKKKKKTAWRYQHLTQVYHKWQSYHIWFLRYGVHQTEFFCYLGPFFPLLPPWQPEKWKFQNKKWKKIAWEISSFYTSVPKIIIICYTLHEICHVTNVIVIFHFGQFFWSFTTPSPAPHLQQPQKRKAQQKWKNP